MRSDSRKPVYVLTILLVLAAGIFNIADLDFWWHLKTGQMILEEHRFQYEEVYSHTAPGREYVDHEWLFQVLMYLAYAAGGPPGVIFLKCAVLITICVLAARFLLNRGASPELSLAIITLSILSALQRFIERPEIFSVLFLVLIFLSLESFIRTGRRRSLAPVPIVFLIWSNLHAAVILGLVLITLFLGGLILEGMLRRRDYPVYFYADQKKILTIAGLLILSLLITGLNPYGFRMLKVPFELTAIIDSGLLRNEEWQRPSPYTLPLFYLSLTFTFGITIASFRRISVVHFALAAFLGYIALKYFRNTGMFALMMPFLVSPYVATLSAKSTAVRASCAVLLAAGIWVLGFAFPFQRGLGTASYFPEGIVQFTVKNDLRGNMLNSYGIGGYLIWRLYPERKIFIDGRNEVFLPLLKEIVGSSNDSRGWTGMLGKYRIEYALLSYVDKLEEVTVVDKNNQLSKRYLPFTNSRFPRPRWALVYWDDNGMVLVRRNGINGRLQSMEYTSVFPEGTDYQLVALKEEKADRAAALQELRRKLQEDPNCRRAKQMLGQMQQNN